MRAFFSSFIAVSVSVMMVVSAAATLFHDTDGHWAELTVDRWSERDVVKGYDGFFRPDDPITLAEFAAILNQTMGYTERAGNIYTDLDDEWYADPMLKAIGAGIIKGDVQNMAHPNRLLTRHEMAAILAEVFRIAPEPGRTVFLDDADIPGYAIGYINAFQKLGFVKGYETYGGFEFRPHNTLTRAEAVTLINLLSPNFVNAPGMYAESVSGNMIVNTSGVTLKNMTVDGNLYLAEGIGMGDFTLNNVTVTGDVIVRGGGLSSVYIVDSVLGNIIVDKADGEIRIVAVGSTNVSAIILESGAVVVTSQLTSGKILSTVIDADLSGRHNIILAGHFNAVTNNANAASIEIQGSVQTLNMNAGAHITGNVVIRDYFESQGANVFKTGSVIITGESTATPRPVASTPRSSSGSQPAPTPRPASGSNSDSISGSISVTGVSINPPQNTQGLLVGDTLQLIATVTPLNATDRSVTWNSSDEKVAAVSTTGLVTAIGLGNAVISATTNNRSFTDTVNVSVTAAVAATECECPEPFPSPANCTLCSTCLLPIKDIQHIFTAHPQPLAGASEAGHDFKCVNCGVRGGQTAHTGPAATCVAKQECTVCFAEMAPVNPNAHDLPAVWDFDDKLHWRECAGNGCGHADEHPHDIDNGECTVCGYKIKDGLCTGGSHNPGPSATCADAQTCNDCGIVINPKTGLHTPAARGNCTQASMCTVPGCNQVALAAQNAHSPANITDCTVDIYCNYADNHTACIQAAVPAGTHTEPNNWDCASGYTCTVCGISGLSQGSHTAPDSWNCLNGYTCTIARCGAAGLEAVTTGHAKPDNWSCDYGYNCTAETCYVTAIDQGPHSGTPSADNSWNCVDGYDCTICTAAGVGPQGAHTGDPCSVCGFALNPCSGGRAHRAFIDLGGDCTQKQDCGINGCTFDIRPEEHISHDGAIGQICSRASCTQAVPCPNASSHNTGAPFGSDCTAGVPCAQSGAGCAAYRRVPSGGHAGNIGTQCANAACTQSVPCPDAASHDSGVPYGADCTVGVPCAQSGAGCAAYQRAPSGGHAGNIGTQCANAACTQSVPCPDAASHDSGVPYGADCTVGVPCAQSGAGCTAYQRAPSGGHSPTYGTPCGVNGPCSHSNCSADDVPGTPATCLGCATCCVLISCPGCTICCTAPPCDNRPDCDNGYLNSSCSLCDYPFNENCTDCHGTGKEACAICMGTGFQTICKPGCAKCDVFN